MPQRLKHLITEELEELRLDQALAKLEPSLSRSLIRKLIVQGAVYLNRKRVRISSKTVRRGQEVEVMVSTQGARPKPKLAGWSIGPESVIFEDSDLILIDKPAGLPTQATLDEARANLVLKVKAYLKSKGLEDYVGVHHRLDRDTSGVMLFTKTRRWNREISDYFKEHKIQKTYLAICKKGQLERKVWSVENRLGIVSKKGKASRFGAVTNGGDLARTDFSVLSENGELMLIEAKPLTGRTHQIRVHLSELGLPILGDSLYGGALKIKNREIPRTFLHAAKLKFKHPGTQVELIGESPMPKDMESFLWA